jgi:hypothetical protein
MASASDTQGSTMTRLAPVLNGSRKKKNQQPGAGEPVKTMNGEEISSRMQAYVNTISQQQQQPDKLSPNALGLNEATWHQTQARRRASKAGKPIDFGHARDWTVMHDPPGQMASSMRFTHQGDAESYLKRMQTKGEKHHFMIEPKWVGANKKALEQQKASEKKLRGEEAIDEKIKNMKDCAAVAKDFVHSDDPKFSGDSKKQRVKRAMGACYAAKRNEEAELDEQFDKKAHKGLVRKLLASGDLHGAMAHSVTGYDRQQQERASKSRHGYHNPYAIGLYLKAVGHAHDDIKLGKSTEEAINNNFNGGLARHLHRELGTGGTDVDAMRRKKANEQHDNPNDLGWAMAKAGAERRKAAAKAAAPKASRPSWRDVFRRKGGERVEQRA